MILDPREKVVYCKGHVSASGEGGGQGDQGKRGVTAKARTEIGSQKNMECIQKTKTKLWNFKCIIIIVVPENLFLSLTRLGIVL